MKNKKGYLKHFITASLISILCGIVTGIVIFSFKFIAKQLEHFSKNIFENYHGNIIIVILVFVILFLLSLLLYYIHKFIPEAKGGGIPRSEGVLRGKIKFKSVYTLIGTYFGSLISYLAGVPVGTEGPSVLIGTSIGDLCNKPFKNKALTRYVNTGGAAAGFAVATGSPFTGILFALEEIHKRFTPMLVISVSLSVVSATFINLSLCNICGVDGNLFHFNITNTFNFNDLKYVFLLAIIIAISVGLFDKSLGLVFKLSKNYISKIPPLIKIITVFMLTGILGFIFIDCIYCGHNIIEYIVNKNNISFLFLISVLLIRLIMMFLVIDGNITGGIFIPILAIAALLGSIYAKLLIMIGMDTTLYPIIVVMTMCVFMGGTLRAPLTGTVLFIELTGVSSMVFYVIFLMFIVNVIIEFFDQPSFYDRILEKIELEENINKTRNIGYFSVIISEKSFVVGKTVRDIMWPNSLVILNINRPNENIDKLDNDGERKLYAEDKITFKCRYYDEDDLYKQIYDLVGNDYTLEKINYKN